MANGRDRLHLRYDGSNGDPTVVAFDPGGTTGWAVLSVHPDAVRDQRCSILDNVTHAAWGQFTGNEFVQVDAMVALCAQWLGAARVTEQFILLKSTTDDRLLSPVRINAALRYGLHISSKGVDRHVHNQTASMAKTTMTDERLVYGGYLEGTRGAPHARDALRHAFTFWKRLKTNESFARLVFPALFRPA